VIGRDVSVSGIAADGSEPLKLLLADESVIGAANGE
jgi:hypothetical protein